MDAAAPPPADGAMVPDDAGVADDAAVRADGAARVCDVRAYGAVGDGTTKDTHAIQAAIDQCAAKGGGTVRLTAGTYLSAPVFLKTGVTLDIAKGAVDPGLGIGDWGFGIRDSRMRD